MKYKHFTDKELQCPCCLKSHMDEDFMTIIERIREELDLPMNVTSAFRCKDYNTIIGGSENSAHLDGLAIDIKRHNGGYARKVVELAIKYHINGIEVGTNHIHLDNKVRNQRVIWAGVSR